MWDGPVFLFCMVSVVCRVVIECIYGSVYLMHTSWQFSVTQSFQLLLPQYFYEGRKGRIDHDKKHRCYTKIL